MATLTTAVSGVSDTIHEDLGDVISRIDPSETPVYSMLRSRETVDNIAFSWLVQELAAASASNKVSEGADASDSTNTPAARLTNYTQISAKAGTVSGTLDAVNTAGRAKETAYQKVVRSLELRRDIEKSLVSDQVKASSDPRATATLSSWISNISQGTVTSGQEAYDGSSAAAASNLGAGTHYPNPAGTNRALTLSMIDDSMQAAFEDGGKPSVMFVSPANKKAFSTLANTAGATVVDNQVTYSAAKEVTAVAAVSVYLSDFGELAVSIDRFMANDRIFLVDTNYAMVCALPGRDFMEQELAKTGDSAKFQILTEYGLKVAAPKAHAMICDLSTT